MNDMIKRSIKTKLRIHKVYLIALAFIYLLMPVTYIGIDVYFLDVLNFGGSAMITLLFIGAVIITLLMTTTFFRECHSPEQSDVTLSLPISAKDRFKAKLISCFLCSLIPFFAADLSILAISYIFKWYYGYNTHIIYPWVCISFLAFVTLVSVTGITFLCSTLCSTRCGSVISSGVCSFTVSLLPIAMDSLINMGAAVSDPYAPMPLFTCTGFSGVSYWTYSSFEFSAKVISWYFITGLVNILISVGMIYAAYRVYKSRDRRSIFENGFSKHYITIVITLTVMLMCSFFLFIGSGRGALTVIVIGFAVTLVCIKLKGIKPKQAIGCILAEVICCACFTAFFFGSFYTDGYSIPERIPADLDDHSRNTIEVTGISWNREMNDISRSELEQINELCEKHRKKDLSISDIRNAVALYEYESYSYNVVTVSVSYKNDGSTDCVCKYKYIIEPSESPELKDELDRLIKTF